MSLVSSMGRGTDRARVPMRTCAGCRRRLPRNQALRLVAGPEPGSLRVDVRRRLPGRGVSVHPEPDCLERALHRGGVARGLRRPVSVAWEVLRAETASAYRVWVDGLLVAARGGGHLEVGTDAVRQALRDGRAEIVLMASDAANRRREVERMAAAASVPCLVHRSRSSLGHLLGRAEVALLAVTEPRFAARIQWAVLRSEAFAGCGASMRERTNRGASAQGEARRKDHEDGSNGASRSEDS